MGMHGLPDWKLRMPVIGAPMFIACGPELVIAQCKAGVVGTFPALNARAENELDEWLHQITEELGIWDRKNPVRPAAPFGVNQIVNRSNIRLERDIQVCAKWRVPLTISSLGARKDVNAAVHAAGGVCFHDVIDDRFARKAIEKGADGVIAVAAGAGGHAGGLSPLALVQEIRQWFEGPIVLSGAIATGTSVLAAQAMGADFAYIGSAFISTQESRAYDAYKEMIVACDASDIVYTNHFSGVLGNFLRPSIVAAGLDPDSLKDGLDAFDLQSEKMSPSVWRDVWSSGQGIGAVKSIPTVEAFVSRLYNEYVAAREDLMRKVDYTVCANDISVQPASV